jgi:hypothetical protein
MSKIFCIDCCQIYQEKEVEKLHKELNYKNHQYIQEKNSLEVMPHLFSRIKNLEKKIEESYKAESELLYMIEENSLFINLLRSESQISIIYPEFELLNCKYTQVDKKSECIMFRMKNIIYMTIVFEGTIKETYNPSTAQICIKMPMWPIYSGSFTIESLYNCLSQESKIMGLCAKYEQRGNEFIINISQKNLDIQTYWTDDKKYCNFTIKGNFMTQPPTRRLLGKFYIYHVASKQVLYEKNGYFSLIKDWKSGAILEIGEENKKETFKINDKYPNIVGGSVVLEKQKKNVNEIIYIPGYSDIIEFVLYQDKKPMILEVKEGNISLAEYPSEKSQFLIIPQLKIKKE